LIHRKPILVLAFTKLAVVVVTKDVIGFLVVSVVIHWEYHFVEVVKMEVRVMQKRC
jgi:hypothetical protein